MQKEYGFVVRMPFAPGPIPRLTQSDLIGRVILNTEKTHQKDFGYRRLKLLLGYRLVALRASP